jgi:neutral ceramidase
VVLDQLRNKKPQSNPTDLINWGLTRTWAGVGDHLPVEVQAIGLGDEVGIVCLPGEIFVELGLAIKQASPFKTTLVIELSNAVETMYVPTRAAYAGGSYEVTNSAIEPGSERNARRGGVAVAAGDCTRAGQGGGGGTA